MNRHTSAASYTGFLIIRILTAAVFLTFAFLSSCKKETEPAPPPVINGFSPTQGIAPANGASGTTVTITGSNFKETASENQVKFNGTIALTVTSSSTDIVTSVPSGATTGKITITVNGKTATSASDFVVIQPPVISSFAPASGLEGTTITITGANFSTTTTSNIVKFNGTVTPVITATSTQLTVKVPLGATSGKITIDVNGLSATSATDFAVVQSPAISSFAPTSGVAGSTVTITGSNFGSSPASNVVKFNGTTATITSASATQLVVTIPAGSTSGKITVDVNGLTATSVTDFTVIQPPTITSFAPTSGLAGATITINGTNFSTNPSSNTVKFNGTAATVITASATQLQANVPVGTTSGKITVDINGQTATSLSDFTFLLQPSIVSFSPDYALPGASLTITGTNFATVLSNITVKVNNTAATVTAASSTQLTVIVPAGATTGKISVTVANTATVTSSNDFEVLIDIPRNGLVAFYPFNSNLQEKGSNNASLDFTPTALFAPTYVQDRFGKTQQSLNFDGTQSSVTSAQVLPASPWTISYWLSFGPLPTGYSGCISARANSVGVSFDVFGANSSTFYFITTGGTAIGDPDYRLTTASPSGYLPPAGTGANWIHFVHTYDGSTYKLYKDGVLIETNTVSTLTPPGNQIQIGRSSGRYYTGKMDDLVVYNRAILATEVMQLFQQTVSKY